MGDDYVLDLKKKYDVPDDEKYDIAPEVWQGHNIADFVDPKIVDELRKLEDEERRREAEGFYELSSEDDEDVEDIRILARRIREVKALKKAEQRLDHTTKPRLSRSQTRKRERSTTGLRSAMSDLGVDLEIENAAHLINTAERSATREAKRPRLSSRSRERSVSAVSRSESCMRDPKLIDKARKLRSKSQASRRNLSRKGEADRSIPNLRAKHLLSGKRKLGKTSRR